MVFCIRSLACGARSVISFLSFYQSQISCLSLSVFGFLSFDTDSRFLSFVIGLWFTFVSIIWFPVVVHSFIISLWFSVFRYTGLWCPLIRSLCPMCLSLKDFDARLSLFSSFRSWLSLIYNRSLVSCLSLYWSLVEVRYPSLVS